MPSLFYSHDDEPEHVRRRKSSRTRRDNARVGSCCSTKTAAVYVESQYRTSPTRTATNTGKSPKLSNGVNVAHHTTYHLFRTREGDITPREQLRRGTTIKQAFVNASLTRKMVSMQYITPETTSLVGEKRCHDNVSKVGTSTPLQVPLYRY